MDCIYRNTLRIGVYLFFFAFLFSCVSDASAENNDDIDYEEDLEEPSDFEKILDNDFAPAELPYKADLNFDTYKPEKYLTEKQFDILQLYNVFYEGYYPKRYTASDQLNTQGDYKMIALYSKDNDQELSTYLVTYDEDGNYIANLRVAYDEIAEGFIQMTTEVSNDTVYQKTITYFDDEEIVSVERYFVQEDGTFLWERDR